MTCSLHQRNRSCSARSPDSMVRIRRTMPPSHYDSRVGPRLAAGGPGLQAPLARGFSGFAFEDNAEIFDVFETRALGDRIQRQVRFNQELFYVIEPDLQD